ncbi:MAG: hypothetical protein WD939_08970 [Dehalococcoidia bacterium]
MADRLLDAPAVLGGRLALSERALALGRALPFLAFGAAALAVLFVHLPVLRDHYFFGDDFVPLADIASRSTPAYIKDLLLLRDETPNWRFLTGLFYLGAYRAFGLNELPFLLASLLVHIGTAGLIFWFVRRALDAVWPAFLAASFFGLSAAPAPTVGQVTAFNNVLGGFLLMLAVVALDEGLRRDRVLPWLAGATVAFGAALAANESVAVLTPVFPLLALWRASESRGSWRDSRELARLAVVSTPFVVIGVAALGALGACGCTSAASDGNFGVGAHLVDNLWIYLGRLLYPVGMEPLGNVGTAHLVAGITVAAIAVAALARGPMLARFAVIFLALALVPYLPLKLWSAPRYVYLASIPFSILAAVAFAEVARYGRRLTPLLPAALAAVAFGVLALYSWQTWSQNESYAAETKPWRSFVAALRETYPELPEGSTVYVLGSELSDPLLQCVVMPATGEVLWGGGTRLFTFLPADIAAYRAAPGAPVFVANAASDRLAPLTVPVASQDELARSDVPLLPHVAPGVTGNLCLPDEAQSSTVRERWASMDSFTATGRF